jgi:RecA-family ATPase
MNITISRSAGPASNTAMTSETISFDDFCKRYSKPEIGQKDGSYFCRGPIDGTRADENISYTSLVILDGDSSIDDDGDAAKPAGAPDPAGVHKVLKEANITHFIYTSHSNFNGVYDSITKDKNGNEVKCLYYGRKKGHKYRVAIPTGIPMPSKDRLAASIDYFIDLLQQAGVPLATVRENYPRSQAWYEPRVAEGFEDKFQTFRHDGEPHDNSVAWGWYVENGKLEPKIPEVDAVNLNDQTGPIADFNRAHGVDWIQDQLEEQDYLLKGSSGLVNGQVSYRYLPPTSESGAAGCKVFLHKTGKWIAYPHNDSDPLNQFDDSGVTKPKDAFDILTIFKYEGDAKAAAIGEGISRDKAVDEEALEQEVQVAASRPTVLQPFTADDLKSRPWIVPGSLLRGAVSVIVAPPGVGKSTYSLNMALAVASGKATMIGGEDCTPGNVWLMNNEDALDELKRRCAAAMQHHEIAFPDITDDDDKPRLYLDSGDLQPFRITGIDKEGLLSNKILERTIESLKREKIDVCIVDPFSETHPVAENSNEEILHVAGMYRALAQQADCAVVLIHHTRKPGQGSSSGHAGDMDSGRGASSLMGVARIVKTLYSMSEQDAKKGGIDPKERGRYVRVDDAKSNMSLLNPDAQWFYKESVSLAVDGGRDFEQVGVLSPVELKIKDRSAEDEQALMVKVVEVLQHNEGPMTIYAIATQLNKGDLADLAVSTIRKRVDKAIPLGATRDVDGRAVVHEDAGSVKGNVKGHVFIKEEV